MFCARYDVCILEFEYRISNNNCESKNHIWRETLFKLQSILIETPNLTKINLKSLESLLGAKSESKQAFI